MSYIVTSPYLLEKKYNGSDTDFPIYNYLNHSMVNLNAAQYSILKRCCIPAEEGELSKAYPYDTIKSLQKQQLLLELAHVWEQHDIRIAEIEIGTYCNWRCEFCPRHQSPMSPSVMSMDLFRRIIGQVIECPTIDEVSLNSYNEPTLDPYFDSRLEILRDNGLKLCLYTNGSGLNERRIRYLKDQDMLSVLYLNIPSADPETFVKMTGNTNWEKTFRVVDILVEYGLPVQLSVQGTEQEKNIQIKGIRKRWPSVSISQWQTSDRLGLLDNKYKHNVSIESDRLFGCYHIFHSVCIDVKGRCFLCCNDYRKQSVYASVLEEPLNEILKGKAMQNYRRMIFRAAIPDSEFICKRCDTMQTNERIMRVMCVVNKEIGRI